MKIISPEKYFLFLKVCLFECKSTKKNEKSIIMLTVFYTQKSDIQASDIKTCKKKNI